MKSKTRQVGAIALCGALAASAAIAQAPVRVAPHGQAPLDDTVFNDGFGEAIDVVRARLGFALAPVPLDMVGMDPVQVGLGSYLVNSVAACSECHTNPPYVVGGDPFMGQPRQVNTANYLAGGKPFGPGIFSRNITPSLDNGLPAGMDFDTFEAAMREGRNASCAGEDSCPPLQSMPWPVYANLSASDLRAIYAYLSVIPHAEPAP